MAASPFDDLSLEELRARPCHKWQRFDPDVLPLWVAEMDFPVADAVKRAICDHCATDNLGYGLPMGLPGLVDALRERLRSRYALHGAATEHVHLLGSTVQGLFLAASALAGPADDVLLLTPLYPPFRAAVAETGRNPVEVPMVDGPERYTLDLDALEAAVTPASRVLMLCNPHNPVGRTFTRAELEALAGFALRHNLWIVSDELHADLVLDGEHIPIASLGDDVAARTLTLYGPTKAFNIPGLKISFAFSANAALVERIGKLAHGVAPGPNVLAQAATLAAYREGDPHLEATRTYLRGNRDRLAARLPELGGARMHLPEATYLGWIDFRPAGLGDDPAAVLLERARVGLNAGVDYGAGGAGFARINFATSRAILDEALDRLAGALA